MWQSALTSWWGWLKHSSSYGWELKGNYDWVRSKHPSNFPMSGRMTCGNNHNLAFRWGSEMAEKQMGSGHQENLSLVASLVVQKVKNPPAVQETRVWSLNWEDPLEKGMATHSSILARRIPWTEEPGGLQSMGKHRVRHDWMSTHIRTNNFSPPF